MSFSSELLDCYDIAKKRSSTSIDVTKAMGSFIKNYGEVQRDISKKMTDFLHKAKKEYAAKMDYSVQDAMMSFIENLESIYAAQSSIVDNLQEQKKEIEAYVKEIEKKQKGIVKEAEATEKGWNSQLDSLKKARNNYVKLGKEAQSLSETLEKKKSDPKTKPDVVSQFESKSASAAEKREQADSQYRSVLDATNNKMEQYYSTEQPRILAEYQEFEENRINFMKDKFQKFIDTIKSSDTASVFTSACDKISAQVSNIDASSDSSNWAQANGKHYAIPEPMPYLTYDIETKCEPEMSTSGRKPEGGSSNGSSGSAPPRRAPAPIPTSSAASASTPSFKSSESKFDPGKYNIPDMDRSSPKFKKAVQKMLKTVKEDQKKMNKDLAALEKLLPMYDKDPSGRAGVEQEINTLKENLGTLSFIQQDLEGALEPGDEQGGNDSAKGDAGEYQSHDPAEAIYSYSAANDTELSFEEGDQLIILQKDSSGWWFASLNGKEGFVPANYVKLK